MTSEQARVAAKALRECADGCEAKIEEWADVTFTAEEIIEVMRGTADTLEIRYADITAEEADR